MRKYLVAGAAVVMHLCLGGLYAWSAFVPALRGAFGYSAAQTQSVFGATIAILCLGSVFSGRMQDLGGPRAAACLGAVLLGSGYLVAGYAGDRFWGLLLGISVLGGLGVAFGYVTAIATAVKWFPGRRGVVTGAVVAGYGCAAILLSALAEALLARGWPVLRIFRMAGAVYGPVALAAGLVLSVPPAAAQAAAVEPFRRRALLRDRRYWRLAAGIFCGTFPGLALIGALKPVGLRHGFDAAAAAASISALAVGNGAGRIVWGLVHDRMRSRRVVMVLLAAIAASVVAFAAGGAGVAAFLAGVALLGFCYGGALAVFPAEVAAIYGVHVMGTVYPLILVAHGAAALVAAPLTGLGVDLTGSYTPGILLALLVAASGLGICSLLRDRLSCRAGAPEGSSCQ